jgi:Uma2 family endonuclease
MVITTSPLVKTYSLQEFWDLPEPADHSKLELIKGVLYMTPPPDYPHNQATSTFIRHVQRAIDECRCGGELYTNRAALWIDDDTFLEPDIMYISSELKSDMDSRHWTRADIVIEILSPSTALYDRKTKSDTYRAMKVREMWLVDTETKEVEVRSFEAGKTTVYKSGDNLRSEILPQIEIPLTTLFS